MNLFVSMIDEKIKILKAFQKNTSELVVDVLVKNDHIIIDMKQEG